MIKAWLQKSGFDVLGWGVRLHNFYWCYYFFAFLMLFLSFGYAVGDMQARMVLDQYIYFFFGGTIALAAAFLVFSEKALVALRDERKKVRMGGFVFEVVKDFFAIVLAVFLMGGDKSFPFAVAGVMLAVVSFMFAYQILRSEH